MAAPIINELNPVPLPSDSASSFKLKRKPFLDSLLLFVSDVNLLAAWIIDKYPGKTLDSVSPAPLSPYSNKNIFDHEFIAFVSSVNTYVEQINLIRSEQSLALLPVMPAKPSIEESKPSFDRKAFNWLYSLSQLPSLLNALAWSVYDNYTSDDFWQNIEASEFEFIWDSTKWTVPGGYYSALLGLEVTATGENTGWQEDFRPVTITVRLNSGADSGDAGDGTVTATLYLVDEDETDIASQLYSFTAFNQSVEHTFSITFGSFDIMRLTVNTFLYLESEGPYIEYINFNEPLP